MTVPPVQPTLETEHLRLRPVVPADAPRVHLLAGDEAVAATTIDIPHPYPDGLAEAWIAETAATFQRGEGASFAIVTRIDGVLIGAIAIAISVEHRRGEIGYWVGREYWGRGFATEAARAIVTYGFGELGLNRIYAHHMTGNPASGRVLEKIGMRCEGESPQHVCKAGRFLDTRHYGILRGWYDKRPGCEEPA